MAAGIFVTATIAIATAVGCGQEDNVTRAPRGVHGPTISLVDSIILEEPDSVGLTQLSYVAHGLGYWFVTAYEHGQVLKFDGEGNFVGTIGRRGGGPGEMMSAAVIHIVGPDSLLAVVDGMRRYLSLFDPRSGEFVRGLVAPFTSAGQAWTVRGDTLVFSTTPGPSLIGRWDPSTDSVELLGSVPAHTSGGLWYLFYGRPEVVPVGSGYVAHLPTVPGVLVLDERGAVVGKIGIPAARRRGMPDDILDRHARLNSRLRLEFLGSGSLGIHLFPSGEIGVVHADLDVVRRPPNPQFGNARFFLSVLSQDFSAACIDGEVPFTSDVMPMPFLSGDTITVLSRTVTADDAVRSVLYRFHVSTSECDWLPTGGVVID